MIVHFLSLCWICQEVHTLLAVMNPDSTSCQSGRKISQCCSACRFFFHALLDETNTRWWLVLTEDDEGLWNPSLQSFLSISLLIIYQVIFWSARGGRKGKNKNWKGGWVMEVHTIYIQGPLCILCSLMCFVCGKCYMSSTEHRFWSPGFHSLLYQPYFLGM